MNKRGLSPVIATVLVIMLTVIAAGIIASFVIPFVRDNLEESGSCFEVLQAVEFAETGFNCYNESLTGFQTGFSVSISDERVDSFRIILSQTGSTTPYTINESGQNADLKMLTGSFGDALTMPDVGGTRTYVVNGEYENAQVAAVLASGNICDISDSVSFVQCTTSDAIAYIGLP